MIKKICCLFLIALTYSVYGNTSILDTKYSIYAKSNIDNFQFNIDSLRFMTSNEKNLILIFDSSIFFLNEKNLKVKKIKKISGQLLDKLTFSNFEIIKDSIDKSYFMSRNSLEVFDFSDNSFNRLDKSSHQTLRGSSRVSHKGHLLNFFGRNEHQTTNFVLDFNLNSRKWNKVIPSNNSEIPNPRQQLFLKKINDTVHYLGGFSSLMKPKKTYLKHYYIYDITNKKHTKVGELLPDKLRTSVKISTIDVDNYRSLFFSFNYVFLIDFKNLNFERLTYKSIFDVDGINFLSSTVVKFKNKIYYFYDDTLTGLIKLQSAELPMIIQQFKKPSPLLKKYKVDLDFNNRFYLILFFLLSSIIVVLIFFGLFKLKNFKKQNVLKQSNYLTYGKNIIPLSYEESSVMDFLILNLKVKLSDIFELECFDEFSVTYKKIYIPKLLKILEDKFKLLNNKKIKFLSLEKSKNKYDKRILEFQLKGNVTIYKGWFKYIFSNTKIKNSI